MGNRYGKSSALPQPVLHMAPPDKPPLSPQEIRRKSIKREISVWQRELAKLSLEVPEEKVVIQKVISSSW